MISNFQFIQILLILISTAKSGFLINREKFTGCDSSTFIFPSTQLKLPKISFSKPCNSFQECIFSAKTPDQCKQNFYFNMMNICLDIPKIRFLKRTFCKSVAERNLSLANDLDEKFFVGTSDFKALIGSGVGGTSFLTPDLSVTTNDTNDFFEKFDVESFLFHVTALGERRYIIKNKEKLCLDVNLVFNICNGSLEQIFATVLAKNQITLQNSNGNYLNLEGSVAKFSSSISQVYLYPEALGRVAFLT